MSLRSPQPASIVTDTRASHEHALVERALCGELSAFNQLVLENQHRAYQAAHWLSDDVDAAARAVRDSVHLAFQRLENLPEGTTFAVWFLQIVLRCCREMSQGRSAPEPAPPHPGQTVFAGGPVFPALRLTAGLDLLSEHMDGLLREVRESIVLHDICGFSAAETAAICAVPVETVRTRLSLARAHLRNVLAPPLGLDPALLL